MSVRVSQSVITNITVDGVTYTLSISKKGYRISRPRDPKHKRRAKVYETHNWEDVHSSFEKFINKDYNPILVNALEGVPNDGKGNDTGNQN